MDRPNPKGISGHGAFRPAAERYAPLRYGNGLSETGKFFFLRARGRLNIRPPARFFSGFPERGAIQAVSRWGEQRVWRDRVWRKSGR